MKLLLVAALMVVIASQVNAASQPDCTLLTTEATCIADTVCTSNTDNTDPAKPVTTLYGCQWVKTLQLTDTTKKTTTPKTVLEECTPSSSDQTLTANKYVCDKLTNLYKSDDYASTFTYMLQNTFATSALCPVVTKVLVPTKTETCSIAKLEYPACTKFTTSASCIADTNCNDAKHGCQWSVCNYNSTQYNKGVNTTMTGKCTKNTDSLGDLKSQCCTAVSALKDMTKNVTADATFKLDVTQTVNQLGACNVANKADKAPVCSVKKFIVAKKSGMAWYWWVLIVLICLCACGACGYGGHKEYQKRQENTQDEQQDEYYQAQTDEHA